MFDFGYILTFSIEIATPAITLVKRTQDALA